jgi:hypothetical protein
MNNIIGNITGIKRTRSAHAPSSVPVQKAPKKSNSRKKPRQDILTSILGMEKLDSRACANPLSLCTEQGGPHFGWDALGQMPFGHQPWILRKASGALRASKPRMEVKVEC